jgi:hypothetical protein
MGNCQGAAEEHWLKRNFSGKPGKKMEGKQTKHHANPVYVIRMHDMEVIRQLTVRGVRQRAPLKAGEWFATETPDGYTVRCGDQVLFTVNSGRPRMFRSLDALKQALSQEMGVIEFKVEAMKK